MYYDYSLTATDRISRGPTLPLSHFEIKQLETSIVSAVMAIIGALITAISVAYAFHTGFAINTALWVEAGGVVLGATILSSGLLYHFCKTKQPEITFPHKAKTLDAYRDALEKDRAINYTCRIPNFVKKHLEANKKLGANLVAQTKIDLMQNNVYQFNGENLHPNRVEKIYGSVFPIANHSALSEVLSVIMSRYKSEDLPEQQVQQKSSSKTPNTKYNLIQRRGDRHLEITQLFQISEVADHIIPLKFIKATMRINCQSGDALISWQSPQNEIPTL
jgi:hypothetical protein